ncbi:MAG TPA: C25 family cysteine peptidase, partial [Ardenticatenaceae bacterium]|nr:C25 family cysteine peptidase [Ardenticatenaceae bacterium]
AENSLASAEKYTDENVYWLVASGAPGPRMAESDGRPTGAAPVPTSFRATVHAEESNEWWTTHRTSDDTWYWERVQTGPVESKAVSYTISLPAPAAGGAAIVRGEVVARASNVSSSPDHHTRFLLNDQVVPFYDARWDGPTRHRFQGGVPAPVLRAGQNVLHFVIVNDAALPLDEIYFDWFEVEYDRHFQAEGDQLFFSSDTPGTWQYEIGGFSSPTVEVYDVSQPLAPRRIVAVETQGQTGVYLPFVRGAGSGAVTGTFGDASDLSAEADGAHGSTPQPASARSRVAFQVTHGSGARYLAAGAGAIRAPKRIERYVAPDLRSAANGADYIIITHPEFLAASRALADHRAGQGLRTSVVNVADLYNEFNHGIYNPIAIKHFLAYAYANWQPPAPSYVLLVGDGHWNFKGFNPAKYGAGPIYMPPLLAWVDPFQGEVDSPNLLATVVGEDILPDLAIGRLPVNSVAALNAAIAKIKAYEQAGPAAWQRRLLFVADNVPDPKTRADFVQLSENIIQDHVPDDFQADRIYVNDICGPPNAPTGDCRAVSGVITRTLNVTGTLILNYIGHAALDVWAEEIFATEDISSLNNADRLPIVLSMSCLDGYWFHPKVSSLAESLVRWPERGAIATFS